jgi:hypothetical protein
MEERRYSSEKEVEVQATMTVAVAVAVAFSPLSYMRLVALSPSLLFPFLNY